MNKKAFLADQWNNKNVFRVIFMWSGGGGVWREAGKERERERERERENKIAMNNIIIINRTGPPQHARKLYQQGGRSRTIADGAQVVACSYRLLLYVTLGEFIFQ